MNDLEEMAIGIMGALAIISVALYVITTLIVIAAPLVYLLVTGDFPGSQRFYGLQEDDAVVTFLLNIRQMEAIK